MVALEHHDYGKLDLVRVVLFWDYNRNQRITLYTMNYMLCVWYPNKGVTSKEIQQ